MKNNTTQSNNDAFYVQAYQELESETPHIATWAKALADSGGNKAQAKSMYLQLRVEALKADNTAIPAAQVTNHNPTEKRSFNRIWLAAGLIMLPLVLGGIYFAGNNKNLPSGDESLAPQPASAQALVEPPAPASTQNLQYGSDNETSSLENDQPLDLVTIKNQALCVDSQNCNLKHGETMECMRLFMTANYGAPTQNFCKEAAFYGNNPDIYYALARLYQNGVFGSEQRRLAAEWYKKAAKLGHAASQNNLGVMYYYGDAVEKNTDLAMAWLEKAAAQGLEDAKKSVEKLKARVSHTQPPTHTESQQADSTGTLGQVYGLNPQGDGFLAVRAKPDASAAEIAELYEGDKVLVLQESNDWVYLKLQNKNIRGWSHKKWIQIGLSSANETNVSQRFIAHNDTVKDTQTGLVWQRCSMGQTWNGKTCIGEAIYTDIEHAKSLAEKGWRLPTIRELASLRLCSTGFKNSILEDIQDGGTHVAKLCNDDSTKPAIDPIFANAPSSWYLSSSPDMTDSSLAWFVRFSNGLVYKQDIHIKHMQVRLVRDGSTTSALNASSTPKTPAKILTTNRFIAEGNSIKDTETGLIWQLCSVGQIWDSKTCLGKPKEFYFDDAQKQSGNSWRLPTVRELASLRVCDKGLNNSETIDLLDNGGKVATGCAEESSISAIDPVFGKLPEWNYWTASEYRDDSKYAWSVGFGRGIVDYNYKHAYRSVRLVRTSMDN